MIDFEEYIRQCEPGKKEKGIIWQTAIGLQQVDGLKPSAYLIETIHRQLFTGIYKFAGKIRDYNISKAEWVLNGKSVLYANAPQIRATLDYDFNQENQYDYKNVDFQRSIQHIVKFISGVWQIHATAEYLVLFFGNLLLGEKNELKNRYLRVDWKNKTDIQSAKITENVVSKSKNCTLNCTLEEHFVLEFLKDNPRATQKEIAAHIGKSERTVKTMTSNLQNKKLLERVNGKRDGFWKIIIMEEK